MTYEERVRALAEEMAREKFKHSSLFKYKDDVKYPATNETIKKEIESTLPAARIAIKHMAEAIIIYAYESIENYELVLYNDPSACDDFHNMLKEQGLISETE